MQKVSEDGVLALGGGGRVAALLKAAFQVTGENRLIWQSRSPECGEICFDPLACDGVERMRHAMRGCSVVLALSGVTPATGCDFSVNSELAQQVLFCADKEQMKHVFFVSTSAVYGGSDRAHPEDEIPNPVSAYGGSKYEMEQVIAAYSGQVRTTVLRLGNVAGADQLLGRVGHSGMVLLDQFPDGAFPSRSYIGPLTLARIVTRLIDLVIAGEKLPDILNIALPGVMGMDALLQAGNIPFQPVPAPESVIRTVMLDTGRLQDLFDFTDEMSFPGAVLEELACLKRALP